MLHFFRPHLSRCRAALLRLLILLLAVFPGSAVVHAHNAPSTALKLDFGRDEIRATLTLPVAELEQAFGQPLAAAGSQIVPKYGDALRAYLLSHIRATAPDGTPWSIAITALTPQLTESPPDLEATLSLRPPPGAPLRRFGLDYSAIIHALPVHFVLVTVQNDWNTATFSSQPEVAGILLGASSHVEIDRTGGSFWRGFSALLLLGMRHIAEGTDHILFLLALLLPAPVIAQGHRWGSYAGLRRSFSQLLRIVTAFTIGHSLTLLIGALGWVQLPARPVDILIALSILVSAVHAIRPLFPGREALVAGAFGLAHGLAFARSLAAFGFSPWHMAMTILSFNLGIELAQLAIVIMVVPSLLLAASSRHFTWLRTVGAMFAILASLLWIAERAFGWQPPIELFGNAAPGQPPGTAQGTGSEPPATPAPAPVPTQP